MKKNTFKHEPIYKELFEWFKIDQAEFDKKFMEDPDAEDKSKISLVV